MQGSGEGNNPGAVGSPGLFSSGEERAGRAKTVDPFKSRADRRFQRFGLFAMYPGWTKLAEVLLRQGRRESALSALEQAGKLAPEDSQVKQLLEPARPKTSP